MSNQTTEASNPTSSSLGHLPPSESHSWQFDADVANCFDDMLARSIPDYASMRAACFELGCQYVKPKTDVVDLGCSRGGAMADFVRKFGAQNRFVGCEVSEPMRSAAQSRFKLLIDAGIVSIQNVDLRHDYPSVHASLTLCILTLQFTPMEYRQRIMADINLHMPGGGALILVEKVLADTSHLDDLLVRMYYDRKRASGYTDEEIQRKRLALEGVLVPVTAKWNEDLMRREGFRHVDCFWRSLNFAGWIAVK